MYPFIATVHYVVSNLDGVTSTIKVRNTDLEKSPEVTLVHDIYLRMKIEIKKNLIVNYIIISMIKFYD